MTQKRLEQIKEKIKSLEGIWIPEHDSSGHHYRHRDIGCLQDSVTTKLGILNKPHLLKWAIKMGIEWLEVESRWQRLSGYDREELVSGAQTAFTDIRDDAGSVGTQAHDAIEDYIKSWIETGTKPEDIKVFFKPMADSRAIASARSIEALFKKKVIYPLASEILVGHPKYSAGTLDFLCLWEGELTLVDFKTSNAIDKISYAMQVIGYSKFFTFMTGIVIPKHKIIHLSKEYDKYDVYRILFPATAWKAFKAICTVYDWMYSRIDKVEKDITKIIIT